MLMAGLVTSTIRLCNFYALKGLNWRKWFLDGGGFYKSIELAIIRTFWNRMLSPNGKKQEISYLYLHAIATRFGYSLVRPFVDMDSVDASICARGKVAGSKGNILSPKIDVQLKATERECTDDPVAFGISKKNYDDLRKNTMVPRILVVLFLPIEMEWFNFDLEKISLYGKGYWMSLKGMDEIPNRSDVTIHLPQSQRLTDTTIQQLMIAAANREEFAYVSC